MGGFTLRGTPFLQEMGLLLGEAGFTADPGTVRREGDDVVVYHYARAEFVPSILANGSGLYAHRTAGWAGLNDATGEPFLAEAFLEPFPHWLKTSPHFGDLGWELTRRHIGRVLLEIRLRGALPNAYVADYAHAMECKHVTLRGRPALDLGYDCATGHQSVQADRNSYVLLDRYAGGHLAPVVTFVRRGPGIVVSSSAIRIADEQPLFNVTRD